MLKTLIILSFVVSVSANINNWKLENSTPPGISDKCLSRDCEFGWISDNSTFVNSTFVLGWRRDFARYANKGLQNCLGNKNIFIKVLQNVNTTKGQKVECLIDKLNTMVLFYDVNYETCENLMPNIENLIGECVKIHKNDNALIVVIFVLLGFLVICFCVFICAS